MAKSTKSPPSRQHRDGRINVSQIIRDYISDHPGCSGKEITTYLSRKKLKCSPSLIAQQLRKVVDKADQQKVTKNSEEAPKSKSQAVRDFYTANPEASAQECIAALAKQGIEVRGHNIYDARRKMKNPDGSATRGGNARGKRNYSVILAAKHFADEFGGIENAQKALEYLEQMGGVADAKAALETLQELQT